MVLLIVDWMSLETAFLGFTCLQHQVLLTASWKVGVRSEVKRGKKGNWEEMISAGYKHWVFKVWIQFSKHQFMFQFSYCRCLTKTWYMRSVYVSEVMIPNTTVLPSFIVLYCISYIPSNLSWLANRVLELKCYLLQKS